MFLEAAKVELSKFPDLPNAFGTCGFAHVQIGQFDYGCELIRQGLSRNPDFVHGFYLLALSYSMNKHYDQALPHILRALEIEPEKEAYLLLLSNIQLNTGRSRDAKRTLKDTLEINPESAPALHQHALISLNDGNVSESMTAIGSSLRQNPNDLRARRNFVEISRNRFLPYRWMRTFFRRFLCFHLAVRVGGVAAPLVIWIILFSLNLLPDFLTDFGLHYVLAIMAFLILVIVIRELADAFILLDPRVRSSVNGVHLGFSILSFGGILTGVLGLVLAFAVHQSIFLPFAFYSMVGVAFCSRLKGLR